MWCVEYVIEKVVVYRGFSCSSVVSNEYFENNHACKVCMVPELLEEQLCRPLLRVEFGRRREPPSVVVSAIV
jgi:hypothetical protein